MSDRGSHLIDSPAAWARLAVSVLLMTIGSSGMYLVVVVLPEVQAEFGAGRGEASLPYTVTMLGFGVGGLIFGRLVDRVGAAPSAIAGAVLLAAGYALAGLAPTLTLFAAAQAVLIGVGSSATFAPIVAEISLWFARRRGIAVAICASGNYLAGAVWPPVIRYFIDDHGWRDTYLGVAVFSVCAMVPLALALRRRPPLQPAAAPAVAGAALVPAVDPQRPLGLSPTALMVLLSVAGVACCMAMSMPQVHIVAYCTDLGFGPARGAQMLSLMLAFGVVSRLVSGLICDRIGGLRTLLLGSTLQALALLLFLPFDGLASLYVVSALFGLVQGGIVPAYAIIVRELFPPQRAATLVSIVITATLVGMALGGWLSGVIFDLTGSYDAAFVHGVAWNALNIAIAVWLIARSRGSRRPGAGAQGAVAARSNA